MIAMPPVSVHFSDAKKLRVPRVQPVAPNAQPQMIEHEMPYRGPPGYPPYGPQYGYHPYPQYPHRFPPHHGPPMPYHQHLAVQPQTEPLISSPGVAVHLHVPLSAFCTHYHISSIDEKKLQDVIEYQPGNKLVENLTEKTWGKGENGAQFGELGWNTFLVAHRKFCEDAKAGLWPKETV